MGTAIFVIYSYPARSVYGNLQQPASDAATYYDTPALANDKVVSALIIRGFDIDYTIWNLTYVRAGCPTSRQLCETWDSVGVNTVSFGYRSAPASASIYDRRIALMRVW